MQKLLKRYLILIISLFVSAVYFNMFQFPNKIITGGIAGISIIINYYFGIEPSRLILLISIILLIIGTISFGISKISGAIIATIIYPIFISLTSNIGNYIPIKISNMIIICLIVGILSGLTTGIVYKVGFSNGGFAIVSELISKYLKISLSVSSFIVNFSIVLIGGVSIGIEMIFYSAIILYIHSTIISKMLKKKTIF